ncbi:unnamed protein product [Notodromas monacha]|nr:unnamed protein product [Notodromas monacha]CAG0915124.1 unnamed protein product [Notodromas monacha]
MFATADSGGLVVQDFFPLDNDISRLLGVQTPFFYLLTKPECVESKSGKMVKQRVMRDFVGLEAKDKSVRDAMMNFSYFLCIGNMDEAFKAIKTIKSETVWENMAKMCVKSKRLDVAAVCLGNMGHARGARCLREMSVDSGGKQLPLDARAGVLALQLGMVDEAERLFRACGRFDLLNKVYQGSNRWAEALDTAADVDRIHLRTTSFNYARHLEAQGDISGAINYFEKSDTQRFEVPRMLFDDPAALEAYVVQSKDP